MRSVSKDHTRYWCYFVHIKYMYFLMVKVCRFILHHTILVILIMRYARKVKSGFIVSTISRWRIKASATQCSTGALLRMLRHGGSQTCAVEGADALRTSRQERRGVLECNWKQMQTVVIDSFYATQFYHESVRSCFILSLKERRI